MVIKDQQKNSSTKENKVQKALCVRKGTLYKIKYSMNLYKSKYSYRKLNWKSIQRTFVLNVYLYECMFL